jgi:DNA-binding FadR family transcriptional regulator
MTEPIEAPVRRGLADQLVEQLLAAVLDGHYPPGSMLPPELEIARMAGVSRLTVREAVKALKAKGVFRVEQGRGTFVNLPEEWSPLDSTLLAARANQEGTRDFLSSVLEARRLVELGTAELAAQRRTDEDLAAIGSALESMHEAQRSSDVKAFVDADIRFHRAVMDAAGNPLISVVRTYPAPRLRGALRDLLDRRRASPRARSPRPHTDRHTSATLEGRS